MSRIDMGIYRDSSAQQKVVPQHPHVGKAMLPESDMHAFVRVIAYR